MCGFPYLLWYAMFADYDSTILVAAHKHTGAQEIMQRIRYAYESVQRIRAGVTEYNKGSLSFDNGSRILSATTTENTGRGIRPLVYLDEFAFVPPYIASEFWINVITYIKYRYE